VYWKGAPLCKLKNVSYLQKHGIITGDLLYVRNIAIDRFFAATLDDVEDALKQKPAILEFIEELKQKVKAMMEEIEAIKKNIVNNTDQAEK
jgi:hypothetical protein